MSDQTTRRSFLKLSGITGMGLIAGQSLHAASIKDEEKKGMVFLFQGDSITDGNRGRSKDPNHIMGHGYAFSVASRVGADFAEAGHTFYNRGISGNRIPDLEKRWQEDTLDLKPDALSVMVGINDASMMIKKETVAASDIESYENGYRTLLQKSREQNPSLLIVLCHPFVFPVGRVNDNWEKYKTTVAKLTDSVKKLASEFNAVLVDFSPVFDKAFRRAPMDYWIWDGIHPTVAGHELMAREWIKQVAKRLSFLKRYKY